MTVSKEQIKKNIIDQLFWDARVDASAINVEFTDGAVRLSGTVSNHFARNAAEEDVWAINGVSSVQNNLTVRFPDQNKPPSDSEIKNTLISILQWDNNISSSDIIINIENGALTLDGSVPAFWQKMRVEEIAADINGVVSVHDRLVVVPTQHFVDELIGRDIAAAIDRSAILNIETIDVQVSDGQVVLSGCVQNFNALKTAENCAQFTDGVTCVVNNLTIC